MTPGARVAAVIALLDEVGRGLMPADQALAAYARARRYIGSKDRRAIADELYATLRRIVAIDHALAPGVATGRLRAARHLAEQGLAPATAFSGEGYAPPPLTAEEQAILAAAGAEPPPDWAEANLPQWLLPAFVRRFGDRWREEAEALNRPAAVDLRVNTLKTTREAALASLAAAGIAATPTPFAADGIRLRERFVPGSLPALAEGQVEPQDEASQLVAQFVDARPGMTVVDLCAGAGGKTLALAASMQNQGRLIACDSDPRRLARLAPRASRAGVTDFDQIVVSIGSETLPEALADLAGRCDRVLVDAPCSGTGTWRRQPDARLRLRPEDLSQLTSVQDQLIRTACTLLKPGGRLVYAVCSVLAEEGPDRIAAAADSERGLIPVPAEVLVQSSGINRLSSVAIADSRGVQLTPLVTETDGFFVGVLELRPA